MAGFLLDSVKASTASIPTTVVALGFSLPGKTPCFGSQELGNNLVLFSFSINEFTYVSLINSYFHQFSAEK